MKTEKSFSIGHSKERGLEIRIKDSKEKILSMLSKLIIDGKEDHMFVVGYDEGTWQLIIEKN